MLVKPDLASPLGLKPKKEMLSISYEDVPASGTCFDGSIFPLKRPIIRINSSSLELIQTCKRKAMYALKEELQAQEESPATLFGSAVHKALEIWYISPRTKRRPRGSDCIESCYGTQTLHGCIRCEAIEGFIRVSTSLQNLEPNDKRHPNNGIKILHSYFDKYADDPFEVMCDKDGPIVERRVEFVIHDGLDMKIIYFGTIDAILQNKETNTILVVDHKTTSALGMDFYNRLNPNMQYRGYVMGAQKFLGIKTDLFLVNGIQVAKTKQEFARQVVQCTEEAFEELTAAVLWAVEDYLKADRTQNWPQHSPNPCTQWGGCSYKSICEAPKSIQAQIIKNLYRTSNA